MNDIRKENQNRIIITHLNINSRRYKCETLKEVVGNTTDILLNQNQFILEGFIPPYRLDRTMHGGGLMLFVREDIPSKLLTNIDPSSNIENIFVEINLR